MRIAHFSDLHLLDLSGVYPHRLWTNKRATGMLNLKFHRGHTHKPFAADVLAKDLLTQSIDHVVVTGDLSNLSLEPEFERATRWLADLGLSPSAISVVPGNHDVYTRGAQRSQRFVKHFAARMRSDLDLATAGNHPSGPFPYVQLRGEVAFIGLSSAIARPPVLSAGYVGPQQRDALDAMLVHPMLSGRYPVVLMHHPVINPANAWRRFSRGLREAPVMRSLLSRRSLLFLHGHLHHRGWRQLETGSDVVVDHIGATSATLLDRDPDRRSGYNVYEVSSEGLLSARARVLSAEGTSVVDQTIPKLSAAWAD
ncbi:MAG: metallophosphoesterase [Deltaproteobacteria bacterium]|nr:metallophosphoesterase [Deltaproteobacteria bacterium]